MCCRQNPEIWNQWSSAKMGKVQLKGNNPETLSSESWLKHWLKSPQKWKKFNCRETILKHCQAKRVKHFKNVHKNGKSSAKGILKPSWNIGENDFVFVVVILGEVLKVFFETHFKAFLSYSPIWKKMEKKKRKSQRPKILHEICVSLSNYHGNSLIPVSDPKIIFSRTFCCCCEFLEQLTEFFSGNFPLQNLFRSSKEWW